jgi:hypothetical protein
MKELEKLTEIITDAFNTCGTTPKYMAEYLLKNGVSVKIEKIVFVIGRTKRENKRIVQKRVLDDFLLSHFKWGETMFENENEAKIALCKLEEQDHPTEKGGVQE